MSHSIYTISTNNDFLEQVDQLILPLDATIKDVCRSIFNRANSEGVSKCIIDIGIELVAPSYIKVPAMFARSLRWENSYPSLQSHIQGEYLRVIGAESKQPLTFIRRALLAIYKQGFFKQDKESIPISYRRRPSMLTRFLQDETSMSIEYKTHEKYIKWNIVKRPTKV